MSLLAAGLFMQAGNSLGSSYSQYQALKTQGKYQKEMSKVNARFAEIYAKDAIDRGEKAISQVRSEGKQKVGKQRASAAAQGIAVDSGSSFDAQRDIEEAAMVDEETIRNNAWREAWGFRTQSVFDQGAANMQALANEGKANSTLLTGGLNSIRYGVEGYDEYRGGGNKATRKRGG